MRTITWRVQFTRQEFSAKIRTTPNIATTKDQRYAKNQEHAHDDKNCADDDALEATAKDGVGDDRERLVDDHVGEEERDEEEMPVFADRLDLFGIFALFAVCIELEGCYDSSI